MDFAKCMNYLPPNFRSNTSRGVFQVPKNLMCVKLYLEEQDVTALRAVNSLFKQAINECEAVCQLRKIEGQYRHSLPWSNRVVFTHAIKNGYKALLHVILSRSLYHCDICKHCSFQPESSIDQPESSIDQPESSIDQPESSIDQSESSIDQRVSSIDLAFLRAADHRGLQGLKPYTKRAERIDIRVMQCLLKMGASVNAKEHVSTFEQRNYMWLGPVDKNAYLQRLKEGEDRQAQGVVYDQDWIYMEGLDGGQTALHHAACRGSIAMVRFLIHAKANIEERTNEGLTALMEATTYRHANVIRVLTAAKADVNASTELGMTPLMMAARADDKKFVTLLLSAKADVTCRDEDDCTVIDYVAPSNVAMRTLLEKGKRKRTLLEKGKGTGKRKRTLLEKGTGKRKRTLLEKGTGKRKRTLS